MKFQPKQEVKINYRGDLAAGYVIRKNSGDTTYQVFVDYAIDKDGNKLDKKHGFELTLEAECLSKK